MWLPTMNQCKRMMTDGGGNTCEHWSIWAQQKDHSVPCSVVDVSCRCDLFGLVSMFHREQRWGLNTYLYAPKDDYKHRMYWRDLYSAEEAGESQTRYTHSRDFTDITVLKWNLWITDGTKMCSYECFLCSTHADAVPL